jgi:FMN phosphatase YigB (HAD superfamily)
MNRGTWILGLLLAVRPAAAATPKPWLFFDLGMTLIQYTPQDTDTRYLPEVAETLRVLKKRGYPLGLLVNWPENEGANDQEKIELLKAFTAETWIDSEPMDWSVFDSVFFPTKDELRKPEPYLFQRAARHAAPASVLFQGEDAAEIEAARRLGLCARQVDPRKGRFQILLLRADQLDAWVRSGARCP